MKSGSRRSRSRCSRSPTCRRTWCRPGTSRARSTSPLPTSGCGSAASWCAPSGFGAGLSGRLAAPGDTDKGQVTCSAYAGSGIGRYITDLGTLGGQDAFYDLATNTIDALPVFAWYLGYERRWSTNLRSTFTYGTVVVDNIEVQPGDAFHTTNRWSMNLTWSPIPRLDLVGEFLFGNRINKDGERRGLEPAPAWHELQVLSHAEPSSACPGSRIAQLHSCGSDAAHRHADGAQGPRSRRAVLLDSAPTGLR